MKTNMQFKAVRVAKKTATESAEDFDQIIYKDKNDAQYHVVTLQKNIDLYNVEKVCGFVYVTYMEGKRIVGYVSIDNKTAMGKAQIKALLNLYRPNIH